MEPKSAIKDDELNNLTSLKYDFIEAKFTENPDYSQTHVPGTSFSNNFPFVCPVTKMEISGSNPVVLGYETKNVVTLKALRDSNLDILPKNILKFEELNDVTTVLHPIFSEMYENKLIDPITSEKFGRPILLYPEHRIDLNRAMKFDPKKLAKDKKKDKKKDKNKAITADGETSNAATSSANGNGSSKKSSSSSKKSGKTVRFSGIVEFNDGEKKQQKMYQKEGIAGTIANPKNNQNNTPASKIVGKRTATGELNLPAKQAKIKPIQKHYFPTIVQKNVRDLSQSIAQAADQSKQLDKYREIKLIGSKDELEKAFDDREDGLKHMFGSHRAYIAWLVPERYIYFIFFTWILITLTFGVCNFQ